MPRRIARHLFGLVIASAIFSGLSISARASDCAAEPFVTAAGNAFQRAASNGSAEAFASAAARFTDLRAIANFALGSYRSALPAARQNEYHTLTRRFIGAFMASHARSFRIANLQVTDCSATTVAARSGAGDRLVFRLEQGGGGFVIRDVSIRSIWLAQQLRSTFVGTIRNGGGDIEALFSYLKRY